MNSDSVLEIFREITKIPRESGHEEKMTEYLLDFAKKHNLEAKRDEIGNVVIIREASAGKENIPSLALQSHQDMVCEKTATSTHNFDTDPIDYVIEDGWMIAKETTLGADDGIGVAATLALLISDLPMGRIEGVFTISEETGMDGAMAMGPGFFTSKTLVNLDSEDEGQLFVGCAGGIDTTAVFHYTATDAKPDTKKLTLSVSGALGGHSGDDINKERANAVQILVRFLYSELGKYQLSRISGGNKRNAIARNAEATIFVNADEVNDVISRFNAFGAAVKNEFHNTDPGLVFETTVGEIDGKAIDCDTAKRLIMSMIAVNHGVLAMSQDIQGLVETSSNLAAVKMDDEKITILTSQRSSTESEKTFMADKVEAAFLLAGAEVSHSDPYPGWAPNMDSNILKESVESYKRLFGTDPEVKAIHAGLECGLFLEKFPYLDMVSFGPTLRGVHAPGEKLDLASNEKFVKLLTDIVTNFK